MRQAESALLAVHSCPLSGCKRKSEALLGWIATGCAKIQDVPRANLSLFPSFWCQDAMNRLMGDNLTMERSVSYCPSSLKPGVILTLPRPLLLIDDMFLLYNETMQR